MARELHVHSDHGPLIVLQVLKVQLGQQPSFTGMEHCAPHARAVHMATCIVRNMGGCENWQYLASGSGKTCHPGSRRKLPSQLNYHGPPELHYVVCHQKGVLSSPALCTPRIIRCQSLEPAAFLMHPVDAVVAYFCATEST